MEFNEYLKKLRKENNLSIRQLALYSDVSSAYLSQIETGSRGIPSPDVLKKLCKPLKVSYEELMQAAGYIEEENQSKISKHDETYNSLAEINKMVKEFGIEDMGFFDIEKWKNLSPDDVDEIRRHFEWVAQKAKERNEDKK
ncbi:helix-turn-helix domain-containing protein [Bacillus sp. ISL-7]|uniref:helix-turn-helix domain-containing protein n=1 Tax=Bacillus sp. ISL-7 TaxID=2819136 RepID=UPI001BED1A62|nr:helix-turn-helix transcriptional regulator [Bacillus sp. ISL-7]MBT2735182.1 helix-turn-helix transcriptional regulator [Bacillus sp. ISL-7]